MKTYDEHRLYVVTFYLVFTRKYIW